MQVQRRQDIRGMATQGQDRLHTEQPEQEEKLPLCQSLESVLPAFKGHLDTKGR